jgi:hypothetical protein
MHPLARITTEDTADLRSLESWLNDEYQLRGHVKWVGSGDHDLEGVVDLLTVPIDGAHGVVLASSLIEWLRAHKTDAKVTVVRGYLKVTLRPETTAAVRPFLEGLLEPDDEEAWVG